MDEWPKAAMLALAQNIEFLSGPDLKELLDLLRQEQPEAIEYIESNWVFDIAKLDSFVALKLRKFVEHRVRNDSRTRGSSQHEPSENPSLSASSQSSERGRPDLDPSMELPDSFNSLGALHESKETGPAVHGTHEVFNGKRKASSLSEFPSHTGNVSKRAMTSPASRPAPSSSLECSISPPKLDTLGAAEAAHGNVMGGKQSIHKPHISSLAASTARKDTENELMTTLQGSTTTTTSSTNERKEVIPKKKSKSKAAAKITPVNGIVESVHGRLEVDKLTVAGTISNINVYANPLKTGNNLKFICGYCFKFFRKMHEVRVHIRTHTGEKPLKCNYCDRRFAHSSNMRSHERTAHLLTTDTYSTAMQGRASSNHPFSVKRKDSMQRVVVCLQCTYTAATRKQMTRHIAEMHQK